MLRKLLKYEFKATGRLIGVVYLAVLAAAVLTGAIGRLSDTTADNPVAFTIIMLIYIILVIAMLVITIFMIIERFYKNMLQGEGYLMHTLPGPTWMHVASKTISALVWEVLAVAVLILSMILCFLAGGLWKDIFASFDMAELWTAITQYRVSAVLIIVAAVIQIVRITLMFYASMAIGASATRHKIFFSALTFIAILIVINIISTCTNLGFLANMVIVEADTVNSSEAFQAGVWVNRAMLKQIVLDLSSSVVLFGLTNFFLKKKLNLE